MSVDVFSLVALTILLAAFVQGSTSMGFAMVSAPVLGLLQPTLIPVLLLVLMIPLNAYVAWRERRHLSWHAFSWISVGRFGGTFVGLWILLLVTTQQLALLVGWATLVAALVALLSPAFDLRRCGLTLTGVVTGITETATGVGGPPLALALQHKSGPVLRSTVAACFLVGELVSLAVLGMGGAVQAHTLLLSLALLPCVAVGAYGSQFVHHRLDGPVVRYLVLGFAIISAIVVIWRA